MFVQFRVAWNCGFLFGDLILVDIMFAAMSVQKTFMVGEMLNEFVAFDRHQAIFRSSSKTVFSNFSSCISSK